MSAASTNILVVEDEASLRELVVEELLAADYTVQAAANGREALDLLGRSPPDLILSDIRMPELDGFALLEATRAQFPKLAATPFIFLSALAERDQVLAGLSAGAEDYITKPIDFDLLLLKIQSRVREAARRRRRACGAGGPPSEGDAAEREAPAEQSGVLVSLAAVRARLGAAWSRRAPRVLAAAEQFLAHELAATDRVRRNDSDDLVLHFRDLSGAEARTRAAEIERRLAARLLGEPEVAAGEEACVAAADPLEVTRPAVGLVDQIARALDDRLGQDAAATQMWLDDLADRADLRAVIPETAERRASRIRYVRLDIASEERLAELRRAGRFSDAHAAQVEALLLYRFLVSQAVDLAAPEALYVLPVSRHLVRTTPLFAIAERVFASGLETRRERLLLGLPASFQRCHRVQPRLQALTRHGRGVSVRVDDLQAAEECLSDPLVRVLEIDAYLLARDSGHRRPAFLALVEEARVRRRVVVATGVPAADTALRADVLNAGVHLVCGP